MFRKLVFTLMIAVFVSTFAVAPAFAAGQEKVTVCHKPGTDEEATLEIGAPAEAAHLAHGDHAGECGAQQPQGCATLNAFIPDAPFDDFEYFVQISDLDFAPGDVIHVDMTVTNGSNSTGDVAFLQSYGGVLNGSGSGIATNFVESYTPEEQVSWSVDYTVVAGDDADGAYVYLVASDGYMVDSVNFSCTPA